MTKQELLDKANDLPLAPGVYLMMDKTGCVIYVGKAKKLKNRVSQYFQENSSHNAKTRRMVSQVDHFDTIFVSTEFEALILENSLIKQHMPRYNILLKDDKGYPFVRLGTEHYPRFTMASKPADDNALYFGPFGGRNETRAAIDAICAAFRLPTCSRKFPRDIGKERPCLNHHMGRCDAFCRGTPDEDEYMRRIGQAEELLNGHYRRLTRALREEMEQEAAALHFDLWVPNFGVQEYMGYSEQMLEVFPHNWTFDNGYMHPGEKPGLGIEFDEKLAAKYPYEPAYLPVARLEDGTLWNW